ncbi:MAG: T9SS type A sorting domain-containing protein, partial [Cytophagales bacterium]|nr:T9SS type A sorting domain-containing protein [Cytophagales bacterium]
GSFSIQLSRSSGQEAEAEITLHNALGRKIPGNISTIENGKLYMDYTSSALPPGMYILNISTGKRVVKRKILME